MKLLVIDGNHIMHRAYHAFPPLTSLSGAPVQAVYGFFSMLIKFMEETKPTHIIVCFDKAAPTFRKAMYAGYQSERPKMADDLSGQFLIMHESLEKIGIPIFEVDGYEADDLIGTLAFQASRGTVGSFSPVGTPASLANAANAVRDVGNPSSPATPSQDFIETVILSGDRDLLQLVNHSTKVLAPIIGITKFILFDEKTVEEKFGIKPDQIPDYKALIGDNSDNYPGVMGIGPKTAVNLLTEYKTIEDLYKNIGVLPEKIGKKLALDAEQAVLCKKLATIVLDAPVHLDLEAADLNNFTKEKVLSVFSEFGFNTIKKRVGVFPDTIEHTASPKNVREINKKTKNENQLSLI